MKKSVKIKIFCGVVMPPEKDKTLEFNQYMKSDENQYIIYADIESLIKNIDGCANNPENSDFWAFDHIQNKHTFYYGKGYEKILRVF